MRSLAHKDPGKPDEDLLEQTRHLFADPIPEMEVPRFGRELAEIIQRGLRAAAKHLPGNVPRHETAQSRPLRLMLRRSLLSPAGHSEQLDYEVIQYGRTIGRFYEDKSAPPELRWCWSITVSGNRPDVVMQGRAATLDLAKARFLSNWQKCRGNQLPAIARTGRPRHSHRLSIPHSRWSTDGPDG
jgi:hypothetical protein